MAEIVKNATMRNPAFWVCLVLSISLTVAGFIVPPLGHIDGSVLTAVGLFLAFATLWEAHIAIRNGVDARFKHGNAELLVGDLNNQDTITQTPQDNEIEID